MFPARPARSPGPGGPAPSPIRTGVPGDASARPHFRSPVGLGVADVSGATAGLTGVTFDHVHQLGELADATVPDQGYLGGLGKASPAAPPDVARLVACKWKYRGLAASALPPLTAPAGNRLATAPGSSPATFCRFGCSGWRARSKRASPSARRPPPAHWSASDRPGL